MLQRFSKPAVLTLLLAVALLAAPFATQYARVDPGPPKIRPDFIRVHVVDHEGRPVPRAEAWFFGYGGSSTMHAIHNGWTSIARADAGQVMQVLRATSESWEPLALGGVHQDVVPDEKGDIEVRLPPERTIEGIVVDDLGNAVPDAHLGAHTPSPGMMATDAHGSAGTDSAGRFRIGGLWDGAYWLVVSTSADYVAVDPLPIESGAHDVRVVLRQAPPVRIAVTGPYGDPVEGVRASATDDASRPVGGLAWWRSRSPCKRSDADGIVTLRGLHPDRTYRLVIRNTGAHRPYQDANWLPRSGTVQLKWR